MRDEVIRDAGGQTPAVPRFHGGGSSLLGRRHARLAQVLALFFLMPFTEAAAGSGVLNFPCRTGSFGTTCKVCERPERRTVQDHCAQCHLGHRIINGSCVAAAHQTVFVRWGALACPPDAQTLYVGFMSSSSSRERGGRII